MDKALSGKLSCTGTDLVFEISNSAVGEVDNEDVCVAGNTLEGDVSNVIALDQLTSPFSPRKATKMSP